MAEADLDSRVRARAFQFLKEQTEFHGDEVLPWKVLVKGFEFDGQRVSLVGQQGIFKPAILQEIPLSIRTAAVVEGEECPYDDGVGPDKFLRYRYRGTDPMHRENRGLRLAMQRNVPLIYPYGITPGRYMASGPYTSFETIRRSVASPSPLMRHTCR